VTKSNECYNSIISNNADSYLQATEREITVNSLKSKVKIKVRSVFMGEQTFADKLFTIADRKLKSE
jgi:hypothetical protein